MKDAVTNNRMHSMVPDSSNQLVPFWFKNRPSRTQPLQTCRNRTISGAECFDQMLKRDPRFNAPAGNHSPYWIFSSQDNLESMYSIASKMGCANNFRRDGAPNAGAAPVAAAAAPAPRPAAASAPAPAARPAAAAPAAASAPAPRPAPASDVLTNQAASVAVTAPGRPQEVLMSITAPPASR